MHHCSEPPLSKTIVLARMGKEDVEGEGVGGEVYAKAAVDRTCGFQNGFGLGADDRACDASLSRHRGDRFRMREHRSVAFSPA